MRQVFIVLIFLQFAANARSEVFRDVRPPVDYPSQNFLFYGVILALIAGIIGITVFVMLRRNRHKGTPPTAGQKALKELKGLQHEALAQRGEYKEFYFRMSEILRAYVEARFNINAPDMTTEEFLVHLQKNNQLTEADKNVLKDFSFSTDRIKYANESPAADQILADYELVINFIKQTEPASA